MTRLVLVLIAFLLAGRPGLAADAGADPGCGGERPCVVAGGDYRIELPPGGETRGIYLFFHGYKGSAALQMGDRRLIEAAHRHGLAFAAADGLDGTWSHPNAPAADRDEFAYVGAVLDDLSARFGFSGDQVVLGGFSQGASMAWYAACRLGGRVGAAVTFSGVFWNPPPKPADCPSPPPIVHFHGRADRTFPLAGRAIGKRWHQGDTFQAFEIARAAKGCLATPAVEERIGDLACSVSESCGRGPLALCLHEGGHGIDATRLDAALTRLGY